MDLTVLGMSLNIGVLWSRHLIGGPNKPKSSRSRPYQPDFLQPLTGS